MREVPVPLIRCRPGLLQTARGPRTIAFGREVEERPVLHDGSADAAAVQAVVRVRQACLFLGFSVGGVEVVQALPPDRPRLIEAGAVVLVAAGFRGHVEDAAAGASHLRIVGVDLHLDFFDGFDRRIDDRSAAQFGRWHAVDHVVVRADAAAAERHARRVRLVLLPIELWIPDRHHRRHRYADQKRIAARCGERLERFAIERRRV